MILCLVNYERTRRGLRPLTDDLTLNRVAQDHSDDMVSRRYFEHATPEGVTSAARMAEAGSVIGRDGTGENIAAGEDVLASPARIVQSWMESPGHRMNILWPSFRRIGIGLAIGDPPQRARLNRLAGTYTTDFSE